MNQMINMMGRVEFLRLSENEFSPRILTQNNSTSSHLLVELLRLVEIGQKLCLDGVILKQNEEWIWLFTSCGLQIIQSDKVEFIGEQSEVIRIESIQQQGENDE